MKHLGDITQINGSMVEPVNVIIGGSPCQDLSVAGRRAGLAGERSGLFMEQIRIIKEMRCADAARGRTGTDIRPRWMVWENVPGAFSSNKGEDFGAVLQETIKIAEPQVPAVSVPKNGWPTAGCLTDVGGKWSVAWRVFDAQFWGVPQRRKRIALVADFGGLTAPEILFERQGVPGYCPQSGAPWQRAAAPAQDGAAQPGGSTFCIQGNCIDRADTAGCNSKGWTEGVSYTLNTIDRPAVYSEPLDDVASTLRAGAGMPKHDADIRGRLAIVYNGETVTSKTNASNPQVGDPCHTLGATGAGRAVVIENHAKAFSFDSLASNSMKSTNPHSGCREVGVSKTLDATRPDPAKNQGGIAIVQLAVENHPQDSRVKINEDGVVQTLSGQMGTGGECSSDIRKQVADVYAATCGSFMSIGCDVCPTLMARDYKQSHIVCYKDGGTENDYV